MRNYGRIFRSPLFKHFLHARQTVGDVRSGYASSVKGAERQLGTRLADSLSGNNPDSFAGLHQVIAADV